jgi:transcriptional regulator of heat shock response
MVALLVAASGAVHHRVFRVAAVPPPERLERIHNYLNELVPGRTLAESRQRLEDEMRASKRTLDGMQIEALGLGRDALGRVADEASVVVQGQARLVVGLAGVERDRIGKLMDLLEEQHALVDLLDATMRAEARTILIGTEHPVTAGAECSLVAVACRQGQGGAGTLAVIGPRSMDYCMVLPLVEYAAEVISATAGMAA